MQEAEILGKLGAGPWIECEDDKSVVRVSDCSGSRRVTDVVKGRGRELRAFRERVFSGEGGSQRGKNDVGILMPPLSLECLWAR